MIGVCQGNIAGQVGREHLNLSIAATTVFWSKTLLKNRELKIRGPCSSAFSDPFGLILLPKTYKRSPKIKMLSPWRERAPSAIFERKDKYFIKSAVPAYLA
jgi:hypothetical protein